MLDTATIQKLMEHPIVNEIVLTVGRSFIFRVLSCDSGVALVELKDEIHFFTMGKIISAKRMLDFQALQSAEKIEYFCRHLSEHVFHKCTTGDVALKPKQLSALTFFYTKKKRKAFICKQLCVSDGLLQDLLNDWSEPVFNRYLSLQSSNSNA